jgi:predicted TIM-barrel fold metal-dependent hydrolase
LIKEFGTAWLPSIVWGMDRQYEQLKYESSWVKKWPSEYFHDHIKLSTQPFEESPEPGGMIRILESLDGMEDMLCFSSDYPHITADDPMYVARLLPAEWQSKVFLENACAFYHWDVPAAPATTPRLAGSKAG